MRIRKITSVLFVLFFVFLIMQIYLKHKTKQTVKLPTINIDEDNENVVPPSLINFPTRNSSVASNDWKKIDSQIITDSHWMKGDVTIVTCLLDIGRSNWPYFSRSYEAYQNAMKPLLDLDVFLYIFADEVGAIFIRSQRRRYANKTVIIVVTLQDLPYFVHKARIQSIINKEINNWNAEWDLSMRAHPEAFSAEYLLLMNSKIHFMKEACQKNPFSSKHFFWLDAGYGNGNGDYPPPGHVWLPKSQLISERVIDKITLIRRMKTRLTDVTLNDMYRKNVAVIVGGFYGGSRMAINRYYAIYHSVFIDLINKHYVDDDQTLTVICYQSNPSLFNIIDGDWSEVFKLFRSEKRH